MIACALLTVASMFYCVILAEFWPGKDRLNIDLARAVDELALYARMAVLAAPQPTSPDPFTAWCSCPRCGHVDCHRWRRPAPKPVPGPARVDGGIEVHRFDGMSGPDESMYEVVRICGHCKTEWGQA